MANNPNRKTGTPTLDMNPMVDMAFLLVTFFLLATTFKTVEATRITLPKSISTLELPDQAVLSITVNRAGEVFVGLDNPVMRVALLERFAAAYDLALDERHKASFATLPGIGVPAEGLADFLALPQEERQAFRQPGIPRDSAANELADWIVLARSVVPEARVALKADRRAPYREVDGIIETLKANHILRFNLVTDIRRIDGI